LNVGQRLTRRGYAHPHCACGGKSFLIFNPFLINKLFIFSLQTRLSGEAEEAGGRSLAG